MICWKIRIFAYWTTPEYLRSSTLHLLWFAEKFVSLLIEQHHLQIFERLIVVVICWKIRIFAYWTTPKSRTAYHVGWLWFAEKFVSLLIEQHPPTNKPPAGKGCDLLKNSYLCLLNNTHPKMKHHNQVLWFAEKFVSLLIEQHRQLQPRHRRRGCDLLKNSYLCLLNNTAYHIIKQHGKVVICWKIRIFAYWTTPRGKRIGGNILLWFAEKFVSLLIEQHRQLPMGVHQGVVICWKIRIFAYWTTPKMLNLAHLLWLWFAEKFVSLLIEQHLLARLEREPTRCDLLKNSYLCLLNNTEFLKAYDIESVVICWKIRIFAYWTTPYHQKTFQSIRLWFAEKFVSLLIEQHR